MICPVRGQPPPPGDVGVDGCPGHRVVVLLVGGPDVVTRALNRVWASAQSSDSSPHYSHSPSRSSTPWHACLMMAPTTLSAIVSKFSISQPTLCTLYLNDGSLFECKETAQCNVRSPGKQPLDTDTSTPGYGGRRYEGKPSTSSE